MLTDFLFKLNQLDIKLWVENDRLRYNAPEGVLTEEIKAEIVKLKPEIIKFLQQSVNEQSPVVRIQRAPRNQAMPLSCAQKWLWIYDQVETNSYAFNISAVVKLKGKLEIIALETSINEIIKRHEILRTILKSKGAEVSQQILPELKILLPVEELQNLSKQEQEQKVYEYFNGQTQLPLDLEKGPLLRINLLKLDEEVYALVLTFHHSIIDNWSLSVFITELAALYKASIKQEPSPLPELTIQYADYAVWQQKYLESNIAQAKFTYWRERLKNIERIPGLPTDYTRPAVQTRKSIRIFEILPETIIQKLKNISQKEGCSLYVTMLAAYKALLYQYTGLEDIIVGSPVAGRTHKELEGLIGFFINTVVLWTKLNPKTTFWEMMKEVRKTTLEAIANQEVPFESLVEELHPKHEQGQTPYFQAFFNMYSSSFELELPGVKITPYAADMIGAQNYNSKFDMTLLAIEHQAGLQLDLSLNADVFAESTGTWLFEQLKRLLETIAETPDLTIFELPKLSPQTHQSIEPANEYTPIKREEVDQLLNVRFEKMVKQVPGNIAVESSNRALTYEELNKQANRLGRLILKNEAEWIGLTKKERTRYARQLVLDGWGIEAQEILKKTTVFAAGAGGSGSPVIIQLALLGIGTIIVCDFDQIELTNLNRQVLHDESRLGMNKAESAAITIKRINPHVNVIVRTEKITKDNVFELVGDSTVIFDNVDDIEAKFVLSECAVAKGIPHVISSMIERSPYAAILHTPHTPCFHCLYDRNKLDLVRELRKDQSGWKKVANPVSSPALFVAAGFACNEALKIILGLENIAYNKYFFFNQQASDTFAQTKGYKIVTYPFSEYFRNLCKKQGFDWEGGWNGRFIEEITLERDPECPICGKKQPEILPERTIERIAVTKEQFSIKPGNTQETIALLLEHDVEMIIGILGVLKSGNIFVTMDPTYPEDRLLYMLEDTGARAIITDNSNLEMATKLREKTNKHIRIININENRESISDQNLPERVKPESLAYIMYTSGSTGYPKGVMQKHRNVLHFIMNYTNGLHIDGSDRLSLIPTFSFSAAMMDTFAALLNGATLCLYNIRKEGPAGLGEWLIEKKITIYHSVPTVFRHFLAAISKDMSFPNLRLIDFGGEPVTSQDVELYRKHFNEDCLLVNGLGATELNVIRQYPINHRTILSGNLVPVGYSVSETEILLIDEAGIEVGYNRPGEIVIKSEFLSPGYWENEDQTRLVFKEEPGSSKLLYYTGDLGRMRTDGRLEHLGRKDSQLKVRGIRIEAAEIETVLLEIPAIKEAVVTAEENDHGDKQLVAYLVEQFQQKIEIDEVYEHIRERLPEYMVPASFVKLSGLPQTFTGKVDRRMLKSAGGESLNLKQDYEVPNNQTERLVADVWEKILHVEKIGINDNFFSIGGDSLKALTVLTEIQKAFFVNISLNDIPAHPTIRELAAFIGLRASQSELETTKLMEMREELLSDSVSRTYEDNLAGEYKAIDNINPREEIVVGEVPLIPVQKIHFVRNPRISQYWNTAAMLYCKKGFNVEIISKVFTRLVIYHDALRMVYKIEKDRVIQYNRGIEGKLFDLEIFDLYDVDNPSEVIKRETAKLCGSVDINNGPLVKLGLFRTDQGVHLLISVNHLVSDWYSLYVFVRDFVSGYHQVLNNQPIRLPTKTFSFKDWANYLYEYAESEELLKEIPYWKSVEAVGTVPFKRENYNNENLQCNIRSIKVNLTKEETNQLRRQSVQKYQTGIPELVLTALGLALKEWLGEERIIVHCLSNGRHGINGIDLTRTMGYYNVGYPFVLDLTESANLSKTISLIRDSLRNVPNQGIGYEVLNYITPPEKVDGLKFNLKTEMIFNFFGEFDNNSDELISISPIPVEGHWGPDFERGFSFFVEGIITNGEFVLSLNYDKIAYQDKTVSKIAKNFKTNLNRILIS